MEIIEHPQEPTRKVREYRILRKDEFGLFTIYADIVTIDRKLELGRMMVGDEEVIVLGLLVDPPSLN